MLTLALVTTEYDFTMGPKAGSDWFEMHVATVENKLDGQADMFDKKGGLFRCVLLGKPRTVQKAIILHQIEEATGLQYYGQKEVALQPRYGEILKRKYGDKAIIE